MILFKKVFVPLILMASCFVFGCTKEKSAQVKIQIDYVGTGGFYTDDITSASTEYIIGSNGPYPADPKKSYTLQYKADENFGTITKTWSPTSGPWTIHCYVSGNNSYMTAVPGN